MTAGGAVWGANAEKQIGEGPFFGEAALQAVDLKLCVALRWFRSGVLDHIPATALAPFPKLNRVHDAVLDRARVKDSYAKR